MPVHNSTKSWLEENSKFFLPPVCNKMMHNDQLKVFYVGGPNQRKDFHLEEGEELFYMRKGDMQLPILENGVIRTIDIKEGEIFLLPGRIPHSPQRGDKTIGLVIERDRLESETDGLRYFVDGTTDILFERWFHCEDLGSQLKPIIDEYFASEEHKTGKPSANSVVTNPAWEPDSKRQVSAPFNFQDWLDKKRRLIRGCGQSHLFPSDQYQSDIIVLGYGSGDRNIEHNSEVFLWQLEGSCTVSVGDQQFRVRRDETILLEGVEKEFLFSPSVDCLTLYVCMDPGNKTRPAQ